MRSSVFAFLLGGVVGAVLGLLTTEPALDEPTDLDDSVGDAAAESSPSSSPSREAVPAPPGPELGPGAGDAELAQALEVALFARRWADVAAVTSILRTRGASGRRGRAGAAVASAGADSMIRLDHEYRQRKLRVELRNRDNPATRLLERPDLGPAEKQERLVELLNAPVLEERDATVRRDAALVLASLGREPARRELIRALEAPDAELADTAAEALARADDPRAAEALVGVLREHLDPTQRVRAARALGGAEELATGGPIAAAVAEAAREDRDPRVRSHAIASLARADLDASAAAREALRTIALDATEPAPLRQAAIAAMRAHQDIARDLPPTLVACLEGLLEQASAPLRLEVIRTLAAAGRAESLPLLETALIAADTRRERRALRDAVDAVERRAGPDR